MKINTFLFIIALLFSLNSAFSQVKSSTANYKSTNVSLSLDSCFYKTVNYLQDHQWFIEVVDKASGFIRAKIYIKSNKIFNAMIGERRTVSIFLQSSAGQTSLSLNIYSEAIHRGGNTTTIVNYNEDKGVINDEKVYRELLTDLKNAL